MSYPAVCKKYHHTAPLFFSCCAFSVLLCAVLSCALLLYPIQSEAREIKEARKPVRVGYSAGYGIISSIGGTFTGYGYEYLREIAKYTHWDYEFVPGTWEECLHRLNTGEIDLLGPLQRTPEREKNLLFPSREMGYEYGVLYARFDNSWLYFDDFDAFDGLTVGRVRGAYYNEQFEAYRLRNGFSVSYKDYDGPEQQLMALTNHEADMVLTGSIMEVAGVRLVSRFTVAPFYIGVAPGQESLRQQLEMAMGTIRTTNPYFEVQLFHRYFHTQAVMQPAMTREEMNFVRESKPLRVAVLSSWAPMGYMENGQVRGIVPDFLRYLARENELRLELVPVSAFAEAETKMHMGEVDVLASYGVAEKTLFSDNITPTLEYMQVPVALMGHMNLTSTLGMRVALPEGFELSEYVLRNYKDVVIVRFPTFQDCLQAVRAGKAEATMVLSYQYSMHAGSSMFQDITFISAIDRPLMLSMGVSPRVPSTVQDILHKALSRVSQREVNEIVFANTVRKLDSLSLMELISRFSTEFLIGVALLVSGAAIFYAVLRRNTEQRLWGMAYRDDLTGYANWNCFQNDADKLRQNGRYAFVTIDIEGFKLINDYFGFGVGTQALQLMADILNRNLQKNEIAARRDSDLFVMLLHCRDEAALVMRLTELQERISAMRLLDDAKHHLVRTVCGICLDEQGISLNKLYDCANYARKSAKPVHSNTCVFYTAAMNARAMAEHDIEQHMELALYEHEFQMYLQPKFELTTGRIMGAEALVRWVNGERGMVFPDTFIPLFEKNGFILRLDVYMLDEVCKLLRRWLDAGLTPPPVAVNISKVHMHTADFVRTVCDTAGRHNVPPHLLELELTETAFFNNNATLLDTIHQLTALGFTLSLDDFGSGYSSLNMLKNLPVHVLKLDREFFAANENEDRAYKIIVNVIHMAHGLHMKVVAEGVETKEQADFLREVGCDLVQGFLYSRPLSIGAFERRLFGV